MSTMQVRCLKQILCYLFLVVVFVPQLTDSVICKPDLSKMVTRQKRLGQKRPDKSAPTNAPRQMRPADKSAPTNAPAPAC